MIKKIVIIIAFIFIVLLLFFVIKNYKYIRPFEYEDFIDSQSGEEIIESVEDFSTYDFSNVDKEVEKIYLDGYTIDFPDDMSNLKNVRILRLKNCNVSDEEFGKIKELNNLEALDVNNCGINSMDIEYPKSLKVLSLSNNNIEKIEGLEGLDELKSLSITYNNIEKIEDLEDLINLQSLSLSNNNIEKIEGLSNLKRLHWLYLSNNEIITIENLENMPLTANRYIAVDGMDEVPTSCLKMSLRTSRKNYYDLISPNYSCAEMVSPIYSIDLSDNSIESITQETYDYMTKYGIRYTADKELDELEII